MQSGTTALVDAKVLQKRTRKLQCCLLLTVRRWTREHAVTCDTNSSSCAVILLLGCSPLDIVIRV